MIPVTIAELIDKLTILEVKLNQCDCKSAQSELIVMHESLMEIADTYDIQGHKCLQPLIDELFRVNEIIIDTSDEIRVLEFHHDYGNDFISAVRRSYLSDVRKTEIKKQIDDFFNTQFLL